MISLHHSWKRWLLGILLFTAAGVLFGLQFYMSNAQMGGTSPPSAYIYDQLLFWYTWGLLFPAIMAVTLRFPVQPHNRGGRLLLHGLLGIAGAYLHAGIYITLYHAFSQFFEGVPFSSESVVQGFFRLNMPMRVMNYYLIVAGIVAAEYYQKYIDRSIRTSQLETELAVAKVKMLKMQMHPHFLFNTLHAIAGLVRAGERQQAVKMIAGLSDLLRAALETGDAQRVPLRREVEFVETYLGIEQTRFSDRLAVSIEIDHAALEALVPSLLLQPLVENAINHGLADHPGSGRVGIGARRENGSLTIEVWDDGRGLPPEWSFDRHAGIGLRNSRERLRHLYGNRGRIEIQSRPGGGVLVRVTIPCEPQPVAGVS